MIKENLIIGNYEGSIDCAMKCGRVTEALLIAYSQNEDLFKNTVNQYFTSQTDNFIRHVFKNLMKHDIQDIADNYDLKSWKECAGLAITSGKSIVEFQELMNKLAERFIKEKNDDNSAICCFILSQNFQKLVEIYFKRIQALKGNAKQRTFYMVQSIQKLIVLKKLMIMHSNKTENSKTRNNMQNLTEQRLQDNKFDSLLIELAKIALSSNRVVAAYKVLEQANPLKLRVAELKDLLFNSYFEELSVKFSPPLRPYSIVRIPTSYLPQSSHSQPATIRTQQSKRSNQIFDTKNEVPSNITRNIPQNDANKLIQSNIVHPHITNTMSKNEQMPPFNPQQQTRSQGMPPTSFGNPPINSFSNQANQPQQEQKYNAPPIPRNLQSTQQQPIQEQQQMRGPPLNPNNKQFIEQIGSKQNAPPRPTNVIKAQTTTGSMHLQSPSSTNTSQILPQENPQYNQIQQRNQQNPSQTDIMNTSNRSISKVSPMTNPPAQFRPSSNIPPPSPLLIRNAPMNNDSNFNPQTNNPPNLGGSMYPQMSRPNTMQNTPPVQNTPPQVVGSAYERQITSPSINTLAYMPEAGEVQIITGFLNQNMILFDQIDPKKKSDHISNMNQMLELLKSQQLKKEQVQLVVEICQLMSQGNQKDALNSISKLSRTDFASNKHWIQSLKRLIVGK